MKVHENNDCASLITRGNEGSNWMDALCARASMLVCNKIHKYANTVSLQLSSKVLLLTDLQKQQIPQVNI